jgi:CHAT domain-containing protein
LSLANSETPESELTAEDILHLDLSGVQLVTLSACTSGQGRPVDGQGLLGFQTAFMAAGAHSLLLSLWSVPDEATSVLMQNFYKALWTTPSISKSEALRQAQEQLRSDPAFADPRNWAAWVLVGEAW